jgi:glyoxylase-like metal-dependent hydrolase (beta-lactamase superfamily II)
MNDAPGPPMVKTDVETMIKSLERLRSLDVEWLLPGHGEIIHHGRKRIEDSLDELKKLPDRVLEILKKPSDPFEVSDKLFIWPQTIETVFTMLEKEGKIKRVDKKVSTPELKWITA